MKKKALSLLLVLSLCLTLLPTAALATENTTEPSTEQTETTPVPEEQATPPAPPEPETPDQAEETKTPDQSEDAKTPDQPEDTKTPDQPEEPKAPDQPEDTKTPDQPEDTKTPDPSEEPPQDEEPPAAEEFAPVGEMLFTAGSTHTHPICGDASCSNSKHGTSFSDWKGIDSISSTMAAGHYYLTQDVTIYSTWKPKNGVVLCLNGHKITLGSREHNIDEGSYDVIMVEKDVTFTLCDCKGTNRSYGTIGHNDPQQYEGHGVNVRGGTFNMYGGKISNNRVISYEGNTGGYGGGVLVTNKGTFNMIGGEITGNTAQSGGGVLVGGAYGFHDNTEHEAGGTFNMTGGTISGNYCTSDGGGVYACAGSATTFKVSGAVQIQNNYRGEATSTGNTNNNVYLDASKKFTNTTIQVDGTLGSSAHIGVSTAGGTQLVVKNVSEDQKDCFTCDNNTDCELKHDSKNQTLTLVTAHGKHPICGLNCTHSPTDSTKDWTGISRLDSISQAGYYYLTKDVTLTKTWTCNYNVNLCLNGHSITADKDIDIITVAQNKTFTLTDCNSSNGSKKFTKNSSTGLWELDSSGDIAVNGGAIFHQKSKSGGCGVNVSKGGTFTMYGGTICGGSNWSGGGVTVSTGGTFNMYGGKIAGNAANGGGVYVGGTFNMSGGTICGNTAKTSSSSSSNSKSSSGGGVYVAKNGKFTMSGSAAITDNTGNYGGGVYVNEGTFTMEGGTISGNKTYPNSGGGVYLYSGVANAKSTFTMTGGTISNNTANNYGGGVFVEATTDTSKHASSTFNMTGGTICGNNAAAGGGVATMNGGTFNMSGSTDISKNTASQNGGGVYFGNGNFTVSGNVQITDNWKNSIANNVYLSDRKTIHILDAGLYKNAHIGVTTAEAPAADKLIQIAYGANGTVDYKQIFTPDEVDKGYTVFKSSSDLYLKVHQHSWEYTASGATITATCQANGCPLTGKIGGTLKLVPPTELIYDGYPKQPTPQPDTNWTANIGECQGSITYYRNGEPASSHADAGDYKVEYRVSGVENVVAVVTYTIEKATPTAADFTFSAPAPTDLTYNGNSKTAAVTSSQNGMGKVTVRYYQGDTLVENPTNAGKYTVKISVADGTNYEAVNDLSYPDWTFTISPNNAMPTVTLNGDMVYNSQQIKPEVTVKIGGTTLVQDTDYTVTYGANKNAGETAGSVTITAKGNYSFTPVNQTFEIAKRPITVTADNKSSRVGQDLVELTYTCSAGLPYRDDRFSGTLATDAISTAVNSYAITQGTLSLDNNYAITFVNGTYTVCAKNPQTGFKFTNTTVTKTYGEADFSITASGQATDSTVTYSSSNEAVATVDNNGTVTIKGAGTTTITAKASETPDYAETTANYTLTVNRKGVTITGVTAANKTYDGNAAADVSGTPTIVGLVNGDNVTVDDSNVTATFNSADAGENKTVTFAGFALTGTKAGNYTLTAQPASVKASITPADQAALTITTTTATYGTDLALAVSGGSGNGAVTYTVTDGTGKATVSGSTLHPVQAGTVTVVATKASDGNYHSVSSAATPITIGQADFTGTISKTIPIVKNRTAPQTGTLTAADFFPANQLPDGAAITHVTPGSGTLMITVALNGGQFSYDSKCNLSDAADETYTVTIATTNYTDIKATLTFHLTDKETVTIFGLTYTDKTYDGQPIAPTGALVVSGDKVPVSELEVLYTSTGSTAYQSADAPKNAGTYQVTYKVAESNENCIGSASYSFTIAPKPVTVAPKSISITKGDALPAFELVCDGLVQGESLTPSAQPAFTCFESDGTTAVTASTAAGTYAITWTNADATTFSDANYTVTKEAAGTLTITARPSSGGGGGGSSVTTYPVNTPSKTQSGSVTSTLKNASKGDTVTIIVKPDRGYVLDGLTVTDRSGNALKLTDLGNGKYTFTMPAGKVDVNAAFVPETVSTPFADVSTDSYYAQPVQWAADRGITGGISKDSFGPDLSCTRAQIITFLWRAAGSPETGSTLRFSDVSADSYYAKAVAWAVEHGITSGTGSGTFDPDAPCTRAQSVTFLYRALGQLADGQSAFGDVPADSYYADAVAWAVEHGITSGIGGGLFGPDHACTRAQIVTFLYKTYQGA